MAKEETCYNFKLGIRLESEKSLLKSIVALSWLWKHSFCWHQNVVFFPIFSLVIFGKIRFSEVCNDLENLYNVKLTFQNNMSFHESNNSKCSLKNFIPGDDIIFLFLFWKHSTCWHQNVVFFPTFSLVIFGKISFS